MSLMSHAVKLVVILGIALGSARGGDIAGVNSPRRFKVKTALRASDGALVVINRKMFELLAPVDDVPGGFGARQIKFFIQGVDTPHPRLYFMNTKTHSRHYAFARDVLGYGAGFPAFRNETYFYDAVRRNLSGSIVAYDHIEHSDGGGRRGVYTLEFWPSDPVEFLSWSRRMT